LRLAVPSCEGIVVEVILSSIALIRHPGRTAKCADAGPKFHERPDRRSGQQG
jgi:hypothetical protein